MHRQKISPDRDHVAEPLAGQYWALPGVHRALENGSETTRADVEHVLTTDAELLAGQDRTIWRVAGDTAVLLAADQPLVLCVLHVKRLHAGRLAPGTKFVPVLGELMDELRAGGLSRAVVAGTVLEAEEVVQGPDNVSWHRRGPFRALVGSRGLVLRFELDEGELPAILTRAERIRHKQQKPQPDQAPAERALRAMPGPETV